MNPMNKDLNQDSKENMNWNDYLPGVSIDCVIFGYHRKELKILILEYKKTGLFALPGGFIKQDENLENAAVRVLKDRTGLSDIYLNQFHTFGSTERGDPGPMRTVLENNNRSIEENRFLLNRFISISYYALVDFKKVHPVADYFSDSCDWYDTADLPNLILDHNLIAETALGHLRRNIDNEAVGLNLLDEKFTMSDLQQLYETILGEKLNRTGFHRKMMLSGKLQRLGKKKTGGAHRAPFLYKFEEDR
ncbi:MAG: NUDIX domain-containing protein [Balneolaceae bacterium]